MCLFHLYRPIKIIIIVTGKIQPIGLATIYVKKKNCIRCITESVSPT
jgi:hypothetical protein